MKKLSLLSALMLSFAANSYAENAKTHHQSVERVSMAEASQANHEVNNALRLKFISRRAAQNPAVNNKDEYKTDDWVDATYADEQESEASKRLNRQFKSKRPHINYHFE